MDSEFFERVSKMTPQRLALLATRLKDQVDAQREPIAIVGMACRLPGGVGDPDGFWELLASGRDAIREVPADRWNIDALYDPDPDAPGRMSARSGGFLEDVANFDASFFGIAAREALTLDPQQRLLLEVSWEALEQAGIAPSKLSGTSAGVFVGICNSDHFQRMLSRGADRIDAYVASGNAHSTAAGRISYCLGLRGPALAIDTACSSSLVAFHIACQSLRRGESQIALAGGVNLMCSPETTIALTKAHMLAPDGRCKTFDAAADGFSRGEGCVVLVLKRLSDALSAKDRVLAVVRGTAVNQDGRSGGLTVPNGPSQEAVVRAALADAGLEPHDVDYVEAHGTGTSLGDPIEVRALGGVFGPGRPSEKPLWIGSVKTNFGHLESAAGLAGVLKVVLSMLHERVPKHLHFREPSPHIEWASFPIEVTADARPWPKGTRQRRAGVSSFGFSGTNAHIVIEEAPPPVAESAAAVERPLQLLCLSAQDRPALVELAAAAERALAAGTPLAQAAHTAGVGRAHFTERLAVVAGEASEARAALRAFIDGAPHPALEQGSAPKSGPLEVVFLFTGQGSQYPGMARALYESAPVFREVIDRCATILGPDSAGRTLHDVLAPGPAEGAPIHETEWTQPALFAVEYGISELWRSFGVEPSAVIGHSVGEYVAACVAGVYTLEEGLTLIRERGRLLQALPPGGAMAAVFAPAADVARAVEPFAARLGIAAVNGPESVVISGASEQVERVLADFQAKNVQGQRLFVSFAAHSPLVEPAMAAMRACAAKVKFQAPKLPIAWNVTGGAPLPGGAPDAGYFERHLREPVRFAEGIASLREYGAFLEVGPHPVLVALAERCLPDPEKRALLGTLRRGKDDWRELMTSLARLYCRGAKVDHAGVDAGYARTRVPWPTYPFQRRRFWVEPAEATPYRASRPAGGSLAGQRVPAAVPLFEVTLAPDAPAYLGQHRLLGSALVAGPVFMELAQAAAKSAFGPARRALADFTIREPLVLPDAGRTLQTHLTRRSDGSIDFGVSSAPATVDGEWTLHAEGRLVPSSKAPPHAVRLAELEQRLGPSAPSDGFYARLVELGIELGGAFRSLGAVRVSGNEALANVALAPGEGSDAVSFAHPGLLDGCLQAAGSTLPAPSDPGDVYLFSGIDQVELFGPLPSSLLAHATSRAADPDGNEWRADVTLCGDDGAVLGALSGISMRRASRDVLSRVAKAGGDSELFYRVTWQSVPSAQPAAPSLVGAEHFAARLQGRFDELARSTQLSAYDEILPALDRLSRDYVLAALFELGFDPARGRRFEARGEAARLRVEPRYERLFARLLEMLVEDGLLERNADGSYEIARALEAPRAAPHPDFGTNDGELSMLGRAGPVLSRVLRGTQDPLQLLFPGGTFLEARRLYVESPYARTYNQVLVEALLAAIAKLPDGARLRILEIGAGTGGTTTFVLPALPAERVEYTFTDLSPLFLQRAAETFASHRFVQYKLLDIENDPFSQGFEPASYDVVIAANVLHATADLGRAVSHAQRLLAPSGMLFLLEGVSAERWVDLTFGLTEGWWRFTDTALRPSYPLIDRRAWNELLARLGFSFVTFAPEGSWAERRSAQQALIVARNANPPLTVTLIGGPESLKQACLEELRKRGDVGSWLPSHAVDAELPRSEQAVYLGALELDPAAPDLSDRAQELAVQLPLAWLSRFAREDRPGRVFLVTRGAQRVAGTAAAGAEWQAPLWGVARGFALEHPTRFGAIVDLPPSSATRTSRSACSTRSIRGAGSTTTRSKWRCVGQSASARAFRRVRHRRRVRRACAATPRI